MKAAFIISLLVLGISLATSTRILFVSVPYSGHLHPISTFAQKFASRNPQYIVDFITHKLDIVEPLPNFSVVGHLEHLPAVAHVEGMTFPPQLYQAVSIFLPAVLAQLEKQQYDFVVCDFLSFGGYIAATEKNIPVIHFIPGFPVDPFRPAYFPQMMTEQRVVPTFWNRFENIFQALIGLRVMFDVITQVSPILTSNNITNFRAELIFERKIAIYSTSLGLDLNADVPSNQFMAGPMIDSDWTKYRNCSNSCLDLMQWMDKAPTIYISWGSIVTPSDNQISTIKNTFETQKNTNILWVVPPRLKSQLDQLDLPPHFQLVTWAPQLFVLNHSNTVLFISHCGYNSATEALYFGVPILCVPSFADQFDVATRVEYRNVGKTIFTRDFHEENLRETVKEILENENLKKNVEKIKRILRRHSGPQRASEFLEEIITVGDLDFLTPYTKEVPAYQRYSLDTGALLLIILYALLKLCTRCCCCKSSKIKTE